MNKFTKFTLGYSKKSKKIKRSVNADREELRLCGRQLDAYIPFITNHLAYSIKDDYLLLIESYLSKNINFDIFRKKFLEMYQMDVDITRAISHTFEYFGTFLLNVEALEEEIAIKKERHVFSFLVQRIFNISVIANENGISEDEFRNCIEAEFSKCKKFYKLY